MTGPQRERWQRVERIYHEARALTTTARGAFLDDTCAGDDTLRDEVTSLLAFEGDADRFLEEGVTTGTIDPLIGTTIGAWHLEQVIGAGGMGRVYAARRSDGDFEQRAAVKILKRGMDTDDILRRFRTERRLLAGLEHPGIARLLDGGATDDGMPYLVMELVDGVPIDRYCAGVDFGDSLRLFIDVCDAVQHAHRALVVHRDLKPSNILVTSDGRPKLLDFGIAKVLDPEGHGGSLGVTATDQRLLTPRYAAPEQVRGETVTTATDVYALGVVLYELVTGRSPYGADTASAGALERAIIETEPRRPSASTDVTTDRRRLRGDLDTIILKALAKDPARRYDTPAQLAGDIRCFLAGHPIEARRASASTRIVKAVRRNRRSVAAAVAGGSVALALAIAAAVYAFIVPTWVQAHLDAARLALLHPAQSSHIFTEVYWHGQYAAGPRQTDPADALGAYAAALRLYPSRRDIRLERDVVRLAAAGPEAMTATIRDRAPAVARYVEGRLPRHAEALDDLAPLELRSVGLVAMLTGDLDTAFQAWTRLDLVAAPDPLVEGYLGILYLAMDDHARAYPRMNTAYRAYPDAGFICVSLADAAAHCGDVAAAHRLLRRARTLDKLDESYGAPRVTADALAASERFEEAAALYETLVTSNPVAVLHYANMLERQGRTRKALAVLAYGVRTHSIWRKNCRILVERADRWWATLTEAERTELVRSFPTDNPLDRDAFSALVFAHRAATLAVARVPPVEIAGLTPSPLNVEYKTTPTLGDLGDAIRPIDLEAWALTSQAPGMQRGLWSQMEGDLGRPGRTLSPKTRDALRRWQASDDDARGSYATRIGFTEPPG